jgi:hypothetical protein
MRLVPEPVVPASIPVQTGDGADKSCRLSREGKFGGRSSARADGSLLYDRGEFDKTASQARDSWVANNATRRGGRPDSVDRCGTGSSLREKRLFKMTSELPHYLRYPYESPAAIVTALQLITIRYLAVWPVPVRATVCGLPPPPSVTETSAVRRPLAVGLKVTVIVQLAPAATLVPQVLVSVKSEMFVPVILRLLIGSANFAPLVKVATCGVLACPTVTVPKFRVVGDKVT